MADEQQNNAEQADALAEEIDQSLPTGFDELLYALSQAIRDKRSKGLSQSSSRLTRMKFPYKEKGAFTAWWDHTFLPC